MADTKTLKKNYTLLYLLTSRKKSKKKLILPDGLLQVLGTGHYEYLGPGWKEI